MVLYSKLASALAFLRVIVLCILASALSLPQDAFAQIATSDDTGLQSATATDGPTLSDRISATLKPIAERVSDAESQIAVGNLDDAALTKLRAELEGFGRDVQTHMADFQTEILNLFANYNRLPPPPADNEPPEPEVIQAERKRLADEKAKTTLALKDAELLSVRSTELVNRVIETRRAQFISSLLKQRRLDGQTFSSVWEQWRNEFSKLTTTLSTWFASLIDFKPWASLGVLGGTAVLGGVLYWVLRPLRRWMAFIEAQETVGSLPRITLAFFSIIVPTMALVALAFGLYQMMSYAGLFRLRTNAITLAVLYAVCGWVFIWLLLRAILAPHHSQRRLLDISSSAASRLMQIGMAVTTVYGIDYFLSEMFVLFSTPINFTIVKSFVATLLIAGLLVAALMVRLKPQDIAGSGSGYRGWNAIVYWLVWIGIIAIVLSEIGGYVSLGRFIAGQIIITGSVLATAYIGFRAARAIAETGAIAPTRLGNKLRQRSGATDMRMDQIGLILSILINVLIVLVAVPFIALQWGYRSDEIMSWATTALTGFSIGGFNFSIGRVLAAVLVFILAIIATRFVQRWFEGKVLARTRLDSGVRNSIKSGVGYIGYFIAAMIGLTWAGVNLSNVALIAGALSVGIGFGLQNIVNNFVSGLIMLVERPIKLGDIIAVGPVEGFVRKINVRATELETFDRQTVIIPNSEVINTSVGNWMHQDHYRRLLINVGVAYGSDPEEVRQILLDVANANPNLLKHQEPFVYFMDFGASSLDFQLRVVISNIMETPVVETELRFAIAAAFKEHGIEIPFPQQDVHIRSGFKDA